MLAQLRERLNDGHAVEWARSQQLPELILPSIGAEVVENYAAVNDGQEVVKLQTLKDVNELMIINGAEYALPGDNSVDISPAHSHLIFESADNGGRGRVVVPVKARGQSTALRVFELYKDPFGKMHARANDDGVVFAKGERGGYRAMPDSDWLKVAALPLAERQPAGGVPGLNTAEMAEFYAPAKMLEAVVRAQAGGAAVSDFFGK